MSRGQLNVLKMIISAGGSQDQLPLEQLRRNFDTFCSKFPAVEGARLEAVEAGGVPAAWVEAPGSGDEAPRGVVLYLHGGGYVTGSLRSHGQLATRLAGAAEARGLAVDYRLAPEHPFPAALDDALAAYAWLLDNGTAAEQIVVAGDSAGGGLGIATLVAARDRGLPLPAAAVCLSPWTDLGGSADSIDRHAHLDPVVQRPGLHRMAALYLDGADSRTPLASPLYADLRGLPPLLVQAGGADTLLDDATRLAAAAEAAGLEMELDVWPGMIHVWQLFAGRLEEGQAAIERAGRFIRRRLDAAADHS